MSGTTWLDIFDIALGPTESCYFGRVNILRGSRGPIGIRFEGQPGPTFQRLLCDLKETTRLPLLLAFVDSLGEFAKLLGLFVACLYL